MIRQEVTKVGSTTTEQHNTIRLAEPCCPDMEIQINNTDRSDDDLVQLNCSYPQHSHIVKCRIRAMTPTTNDSTVILSSPDGNLLFPSEPQATVVVPRDAKQWAAFGISGNKPSTSIGDAVIDVRCNSAAGKVITTKAVTVFWFQARLVLQTNVQAQKRAPGKLPIKHGYRVIENKRGKFYWQYTHEPEDEDAVGFSATAQLRPTGLNCKAPQIAPLRVGIMQEVNAPTYQLVNTWNYPDEDYWNSSVAVGIKIKIPRQISEIWTYAPTVPGWVHDGSGTSPLYRPDPGDPRYNDSLQPITSCDPKGTPATCGDTPDHRATRSCTRLVDINGNILQPGSGSNWVACVTWGHKTGVPAIQQIAMSHAENFRTYCVIYNIDTKQYCALRQASWNLNSSSRDPGVHSGGQPAEGVLVGQDSVAQQDPAIGVNANDLTEESGAVIVTYSPRLPLDLTTIEKTGMDSTRDSPKKADE
jgi:hypothetical protein